MSGKRAKAIRKFLREICLRGGFTYTRKDYRILKHRYAWEHRLG